VRRGGRESMTRNARGGGNTVEKLRLRGKKGSLKRRRGRGRKTRNELKPCQKKGHEVPWIKKC